MSHQWVNRIRRRKHCILSWKIWTLCLRGLRSWAAFPERMCTAFRAAVSVCVPGVSARSTPRTDGRILSASSRLEQFIRDESVPHKQQLFTLNWSTVPELPDILTYIDALEK